MKHLSLINLLGVLALGLLCAAQWQANRQLNLQTVRLESVRLDMAAEQVKQARAIDGLTSDLESFRQNLSRAEASSRQSSQELTEARQHRQRLEQERDLLARSVAQWTHAVAERDARIEEAGQSIRQLSAQLQTNTAQFNALAERHNTLVAQWNAAQASRAQP